MSEAPNAWRIQQAMSVYQAARAVMMTEPDAIFDMPDVSEVKAIKEQLLSAIQWNAANAKAVVAMIDDLATRKARFQDHEKKARATLFAVMDALGETKCVLPHGTISISAGRPSLVITDETAIPAEYLRTTVAPDKAAILADLKEGVVIEGAEMSNAPPVLTIRSK